MKERRRKRNFCMKIASCNPAILDTALILFLTTHTRTHTHTHTHTHKLFPHFCKHTCSRTRGRKAAIFFLIFISFVGVYGRWFTAAHVTRERKSYVGHRTYTHAEKAKKFFIVRWVKRRNWVRLAILATRLAVNFELRACVLVSSLIKFQGFKNVPMFECFNDV